MKQRLQILNCVRKQTLHEQYGQDEWWQRPLTPSTCSTYGHVNIVSSWTWKILKLPFKLFLLTENSVRGQCGHLWGHPGLCQQGATEGKKNLFSPSVITSKVFTKSKFFLFRCYQNILESNFSCFIYSSFSVSDLINASVSSETTNRLINSELNHLILSRDI